MMGQAPGDHGAEKGFSSDDFANRIWQNMGSSLFDQVSSSPQRHHLANISIVAVGREDEHLRRRLSLEDLPCSLNAIELRHGNVHHHHIGAKLGAHGNSQTAILDLPDNFDTRFQSEKGTKALPYDGVVLS